MDSLYISVKAGRPFLPEPSNIRAFSLSRSFAISPMTLWPVGDQAERGVTE